jgi:hypothetical protein
MRGAVLTAREVRAFDTNAGPPRFTIQLDCGLFSRSRGDCPGTRSRRISERSSLSAFCGVDCDAWRSAALFAREEEMGKVLGTGQKFLALDDLAKRENRHIHILPSQTNRSRIFPAKISQAVNAGKEVDY